MEVKKEIALATDAAQDVLIRDLVLVGDLSRFTPDQRVEYYNRMCDALELNPITRPFDFITLQGKVVLYAKKEATEQMRKKYGISVIDLQSKIEDGLYIVTVKVQDAKGRLDMATAAIDIKGKAGEGKANAIMKCETKAKRRATLSISGLGMLDEVEIEDIPDADKASIKIDTDGRQKGDATAAKVAISQAADIKRLDEIERNAFDKYTWTDDEKADITEKISFRRDELKAVIK